MEKEIDIEELKKIELNLLTQFHNVCTEQNFRYSLGGGTLLGAVRHNGFIPWDDDIDVMMPRPDYNRFINYCLNNDVPFKILSWETDKTYVDLSARVYDSNTILKEANMLDSIKNIGVYIDVFPIDGLGNTYKEALKAFKSTSFKRNMLVAAQWKKYLKSKTHPWYVEPIRFTAFIISRFVNKQKTFRKILKKYNKYDFDSVKYVAAVGGAYREKEILSHKVFSEYTLLKFEDKDFYVIKEFDTYLSSIYGNYMKLPPIEKQISHHTFKAYYLDNSSN